MSAYRIGRKFEIRTVAKFSTPALVALAALVAFGCLGLAPAVVAAAAVTAAIAVLAWRSARAVHELDAKHGSVRRTGASDPEALSEDLDALAGILDALPDPLLVLDRGRRVLRANAAARSAFGSAGAGRDLAMSLRQPAVLEAADAVLTGGAARDVGFALPGPVGRYFAGRVVPLSMVPPGDAAAIVAFHDLTAVREAERMRADFVANASHELKTPLSTLLGSIETLRGPGREDRAAFGRFLPIMHGEAARMSRLIDDLLSLSRIERNERIPPQDRLDVRPAIRAAAENFAVEAAARGMTIALDLPEVLGLAIGDGDELGQVWRNLIDNAIKYGRAGTTVTARAAEASVRGEPSIAVTIIDRGEGIAPEHVPRLTERFYRVDGTRSRALGGTGLGLAIVKHIVNRHGGTLTAESEPGVGSTFTVVLPVAAVALQEGRHKTVTEGR